jgi:hypothetical protein
MFDALKQRMRRFMAAPSGTRFRAFYERHHRQPHLVRTVLAIGAGLLLIAVGLALLVLPGPGLLVATFGLAMLAGESRRVANLMDRVDQWLTTRWQRWRHRRKQH